MSFPLTHPSIDIFLCFSRFMKDGMTGNRSLMKNYNIIFPADSMLVMMD